MFQKNITILLKPMWAWKSDDSSPHIWHTRSLCSGAIFCSKIFAKPSNGTLDISQLSAGTMAARPATLQMFKMKAQNAKNILVLGDIYVRRHARSHNHFCKHTYFTRIFTGPTSWTMITNATAIYMTARQKRFIKRSRLQRSLSYIPSIDQRRLQAANIMNMHL